MSHLPPYHTPEQRKAALEQLDVLLRKRLKIGLDETENYEIAKIQIRLNPEFWEQRLDWGQTQPPSKQVLAKCTTQHLLRAWNSAVTLLPVMILFVFIVMMITGHLVLVI